LNPVL